MIWYSFYGGDAQGVWERHLQDAYEAAFPNIRVTYAATGLYGAQVPADALDKQLTSDQAPDVMTGFIGGASLARYVEEGRISDLTGLWAAEGLDGAYPDSVANLAKVDGIPYFVPLTVQWNPIFYRADVFEVAGVRPPDSWNSLLDVCRKLHDAGVVPFADSAALWTPPNARWFSLLDLRLNGPEFHQSLMAGEISFEDPRVRNVFEHWLEMLNAGCFDKADHPGSWSQAVAQVMRGDAAMFNIGEWLYEFITPSVKDQLDFFRFPTLNPGIEDGEIALVYGAYVPSTAAHPEAGRAFIHYLLTDETLQSNLDEVHRLIPLNRIPVTAFPPYQQKGLGFVQQSDALSELFEFNAFRGSLATRGLTELAAFWKQRDEAAIDSAQAGLEAARQQALSQGAP
jgi:multiple sugar transport system substrate-binding protein